MPMITKSETTTSLSANANTLDGMVRANGLLETLWPKKEDRPSLRWLKKQQAARSIPFLKVGKCVFYVPSKVRKALERHFTIEARG